MNIVVLNEDCSGPNAACRAAHRAGRPVHVVAISTLGENQPALVMPTYHYASPDDGIAALNEAWATAPTIENDDQLVEYRRAGRPYKLRPGWIDPTRR